MLDCIFGHQVAIWNESMIATCKAHACPCMFIGPTWFLLGQFSHHFVLFDVCDTSILYVLMLLFILFLINALVYIFSTGLFLIFFFIIVHVYSFKVQRNYKDYNRNAASIIPSPLDPSSKSLSTVFQLSLSWYLPPVVETVSCLHNIHLPPLLLTNEISVLLKLTVCPAEKTTFPSFTCKKSTVITLWD